MSDLTVVAAATRLGADYARLVDGRDATGWSELFADPDGFLEFGGQRYVGREALRDFAAASPVGVHLPGLLAVTVDGVDGTITSESPFFFVNGRGRRLLAGYYRDDLVWQGDRLVFAARRVDLRATSPVTSSPPPSPASPSPASPSPAPT